MRCLVNKSDIYIAGSYETEVAATFMVVFELCDPKNTNKTGITCAPEKNQTLWMENQYILTIDN